MKRELIVSILISGLLTSEAVMAKDDVMSFGMTGGNMLDSIDSIGLNGNKFSLVFRGQTQVPNGTMTGAGVFEGIITEDDRMTMRDIRAGICSMKEGLSVRPGNRAYFVPSVTCPDGREIRGMIDIPSLPPTVGGAVLSPTRALISKFYDTGTAVARLDGSVEIQPKDGKLLFIIAFKNSGEESTVVFNSPAIWREERIPLTKDSQISVGGISLDGSDQLFGVYLRGDEFVNAEEYPAGIVEIPPRQVRYLKFISRPDNRILKGRYRIEGSATIAAVTAPEKLKGSVEFQFPSAIVNISENYPSNDADLQKFEQYRRELLFERSYSLQEPVKETGYYRAYGMDDTDRDDFPQLLHKGQTFPQRTMERRDGGRTRQIGPAKLWRWEAYPDAKVSAQTGEPCPRAGLWVPSMFSGMTPASMQMYSAVGGPRELKYGERLPSLGLETNAIAWSWIGPSRNR